MVQMRFPGICMNHDRIGFDLSPSLHYTKSYNSIYDDDGDNDDGLKFSDSSKKNGLSSSGETMKKTEYPGGGNRVMVVIDDSSEADTALRWSLSNTVQSDDTLVLLHVTKPSKQGQKSKRRKGYDHLCSTDDICQMKRLGINFEMAVAEGEDKGATIVEEAKQQRVSLLVLGQRRRSLLWRWRRHNKDVEYCIQNASCMTIAIRRKSRKHGGYLITTKHHADFWLLA